VDDLEDIEVLACAVYGADYEDEDERHAALVEYLCEYGEDG
jgi:hypothetical protein